MRVQPIGITENGYRCEGQRRVKVQGKELSRRVEVPRLSTVILIRIVAGLRNKKNKWQHKHII